MLFIAKKKMSISEKFEKQQKEMMVMVKIAIGHRTVEDFIKQMRMVDTKPIVNLLKKNYKELPDRQLLRKIASASEGRVSFQLLYSIWEYSEHDPEEDRTWAKWVPQWGSVYMCDLGTGEDSIQGGIRPVVVIQNNKGNQYSPNVCILPVSSSKCKNFSSFLHISLEKELGFDRDSFCMAEMPMTISKRRFFYNSTPYKITTLPDYKMKEIQFALEKQFGFTSLMFDEEHAFELVKSIRLLQQNIKIKKSNNLVNILNDKKNELTTYCLKYRKNYKRIIAEYDRLNNYAYEAI